MMSPNMHGPDELRHDVPGNTPPREVPTRGEGQSHGRVEVGAADRAHEEDDAHDHHAGGQRLHCQGQVGTECLGTDHTATSSHHHEQERAPGLTEESPVLKFRVAEVVFALENSGVSRREPLKARDGPVHQ
jgi:hypothetical protein